MIARLSSIMISRVVTKLVDNNNITEVKSAGWNKVFISFNNYKKYLFSLITNRSCTI